MTEDTQSTVKTSDKDGKWRPFQSQLTEEQKTEKRKGKVRVWITYLAALYVFFGSAYLIFIFLMHEGEVSEGMEGALTLFNTTLPIATGIITYWFAARSNSQKNGTPPSGELRQ